MVKRNLSMEGWCYHPQMPELIDLAKACPDVTIILDHFGGPLGIGPYEGRREEIFEEWKGYLADIAQCENVVAKLGGLNMDYNGFGWETSTETAHERRNCSKRPDRISSTQSNISVWIGACLNPISRSIN